MVSAGLSVLPRRYRFCVVSALVSQVQAECWRTEAPCKQRRIGQHSTEATYPSFLVGPLQSLWKRLPLQPHLSWLGNTTGQPSSWNKTLSGELREWVWGRSLPENRGANNYDNTWFVMPFKGGAEREKKILPSAVAVHRRWNEDHKSILEGAVITYHRMKKISA